MDPLLMELGIIKCGTGRTGAGGVTNGPLYFGSALTGGSDTGIFTSAASVFRKNSRYTTKPINARMSAFFMLLIF